MPVTGITCVQALFAPRGPQHSVDEPHTGHALSNSGTRRSRVGPTTFDTGAYPLGQISVDLSKRFNVSLGVPGRQARCMQRPSGRAGAGAAEALGWLAIVRELQIIHLRVRPFETGRLTKDAESKIVFATYGHLACPQHPLGAAPEAHEYVKSSSTRRPETKV